jgi:hypothetical protein
MPCVIASSLHVLVLARWRNASRTIHFMSISVAMLRARIAVHYPFLSLLRNSTPGFRDMSLAR